MTKVKNSNQKTTSTSEHRRNQVQKPRVSSHNDKPTAPNPKMTYSSDRGRTQSQRLKSHSRHNHKRLYTNDEDNADDYSNRYIVRPHKKRITQVDSLHKREFTVQCILDLLINKYPAYRSYVDMALQYIDPDAIILNIREAEYHINHICKNMKMGFFQTMIIRNVVTSTLAGLDMPK
jgi:hypothetical protein